MIFAWLSAAQLEAIEGALAGQRRTVAAMAGELARQGRHHRIMAELIMVVEIFIAQRHAEHTLANERLHLMLDEISTPPILEAPGEPTDQVDRAIGRSQ